MEKVVIQINNFEAYKLLELLEKLQIIKIIKKQDFSRTRLSEKYQAILSEKVASELQNQLLELRKEWESRNI